MDNTSEITTILDNLRKGGFINLNPQASGPENVTPELNASEMGNFTIDTNISDVSSDVLSQQLSQFVASDIPMPDDSALRRAEEAGIDITQDIGRLEQERQSLERRSGIPELEAQRRDVTSQLRNLQASLTAGLNREADRVVPMGVITGRQASLQRQALGKAQALEAIDAALQGNVETARSKVNDVINLKYSALDSQLKTIDRIIDVNKDRFNLAERRLAEQRQQQISLLSNELNNRRQVESSTMSSIVQATSNGLSASRASQLMSGIQDGSIDVYSALAESAYYNGRADRLDYAIKAAQYDAMINEINNPTNLSAEDREKIGKFAPAQDASLQISLVKDLYELRQLVQEHGTINILDAEARGRIQSLRSNLEIKIAVAGGQGAISEGEAERYGKIIGSDFRFQDEVIGGLDQAISFQNGAIKNNIELTNATYPGAINFEPFAEYLADEQVADYVSETVPQTPGSANPYINWINNFLPQK